MTDKKRNSRKKKWWEGRIVLINGIRVSKALLLGICLPIGISLIVSFSVVSFFLWQDHQKMASIEREEVEEAGTSGTVPELSQTVQVLERHREATGLAESESLILEGNYSTGGMEFGLTIFVKRPDLFRQQLEYRDLTIIYGWNGRGYWEHNPASQLGERAVVRHAINLAMLKMQASPASLVWQYLEDGSASFEWLEMKEVDERICDVLSNRGLLTVPVRHFIDRETGLELRREATIVVDSEIMQVIMLFQHDDQPETAEETAELIRHGLPTGYQLYLNDLMIAEARFENLRVNVGVMSWLFERLEE